LQSVGVISPQPRALCGELHHRSFLLLVFLLRALLPAGFYERVLRLGNQTSMVHLEAIVRDGVREDAIVRDDDDQRTSDRLLADDRA
jgi:hypothetical protein